MTKLRATIVLFLTPIFAGCAPWPLEMTSPVTGKVIDAHSGYPVVGARVYFSQFPNDVAISTEDGKFFIKPIRKSQIAVIGTDLRPNYTLMTEAKSYRSNSKNWYVGDDQEQVIKLELDDER